MQIFSTLQHGKYLNEIAKLSKSDVVHVHDLFDQTFIDTLLATKGTPRCLISDHFSKVEFDRVEVFCLPLFIEKEIKKILKNNLCQNEVVTSTCFNFIVNKKQINRFLCIKLVELFGLQDFDYTWSAVDQNFDMSLIISELDYLGQFSPLSPDERSFLLQPIKLKKKWFDYMFQTPNNISINNYGDNDWSWQNGLQQLFLRSAISLITESVTTQKGAAFTEKTLYAVLGLTFPIWVGGYNQAKEWHRLGFDIFDDVIDHSYQDYDTLIERCYFAIANNIELLSNKEKIAHLRNSLKDRLIQNCELLFQNHLERVVDHEITKLPKDLQLLMPDILKYFRNQTP